MLLVSAGNLTSDPRKKKINGNLGLPFESLMETKRENKLVFHDEVFLVFPFQNEQRSVSFLRRLIIGFIYL